ncbi:hypothetical protein [Streptomyces sp. NPDC006267]|uniref:hypothetical protein n=1 Tax=Streptomyces sp. NPDC006267 TaxID=3157173 RepID=UPI0033A09FA4
MSLVAAADALVVAPPPSIRPPTPACSRPSSTCCPRARSPGNRGFPPTGGSPAHFLTLDYALRPVLTALGAQVRQDRLVLDRHITATPDGATALDHHDEHQLSVLVGQFARALPNRAQPVTT